MDTYSQVAAAKLYTTKTPVTTADLLNDRVLPFFEQHSLPLLRNLTDFDLAKGEDAFGHTIVF